MCDSLICPPSANYCSVEIQSIDEQLEWVEKKRFCLNNDLDVVEFGQVVAPSPQPGIYIETEFNNYSYAFRK